MGTRSGGRRLRVAAVAVSMALAGCGTPPTLSNVVYQNFGGDAAVVAERDSVPDVRQPSYRANRYHYAPGAIFNGRQHMPSDTLAGNAGVIAHANPECFHRAYTIGDVDQQRVNDIEVVYEFDTSFPLLFSREDALRSFRQDFRLNTIPPNVVANIESVSIILRNVRVYEASVAQVQRALADIVTRHGRALRGQSRGGFCRLVGREQSALVVTRVAVADVDVRVRWDKGVSVRLGIFWQARIQRSLRFVYSGRRAVIAVVPRPIPAKTVL